MRNDHDWLHMIWAANDWEHGQGLIDPAGEENRRKLAQHPQLSAAVAATFHQQLCLRIDRYRTKGVTLRSLDDRIESIVKLFQLMGYNEWYAGHEGGIRQLIWRTAHKPWGVDLDETSLQGDEQVRLLVAYYLAFTDWALEAEIEERQVTVLKATGEAEPKPDTSSLPARRPWMLIPQDGLLPPFLWNEPVLCLVDAAWQPGEVVHVLIDKEDRWSFMIWADCFPREDPIRGFRWHEVREEVPFLRSQRN